MFFFGVLVSVALGLEYGSFVCRVWFGVFERCFEIFIVRICLWNFTDSKVFGGVLFGLFLSSVVIFELFRKVFVFGSCSVYS